MMLTNINHPCVFLRMKQICFWEVMYPSQNKYRLKISHKLVALIMIKAPSLTKTVNESCIQKTRALNMNDLRKEKGNRTIKCVCTLKNTSN